MRISDWSSDVCSSDLPPPLLDPRQVADAMVSLALHPRHTTSVGATATLLRLAHFLTPGFDRLNGLLTGFALGRAQRVAPSSGNLFHPPLGQRRIDGGWRSSSDDDKRWLLDRKSTRLNSLH